MASVGVCWVRVLCSGAIGLSLTNGESKEENALGPSSSLGLEMVQSFPDFTGTRTNLQHVCVSVTRVYVPRFFVLSQQRFGATDIKALGASQLSGLGQTVLQLLGKLVLQLHFI